MNKEEKEKIISNLTNEKFVFKDTVSYQPVNFYQNIYCDFYKNFCSRQFAILCYLYVKKRLVNIAKQYNLNGDIIDNRIEALNKYLHIDYIDYSAMVYLSDCLKIKDKFDLTFLKYMFCRINGKQVFVYDGNIQQLLKIQRCFRC